MPELPQPVASWSCDHPFCRAGTPPFTPRAPHSAADDVRDAALEHARSHGHMVTFYRGTAQRLRVPASDTALLSNRQEEA